MGKKARVPILGGGLIVVAFSIIPIQKVHHGLIFDPEHYHPDRIAALTKLRAASSSNVSDYFSEITALITPGLNSVNSDVFDLTDALGWLLGEGDRPIVINSSKKQARPNDLVISRLRSYLEEVCIVPSRSENYAPLFSTEFIVLRPTKDNDSTSWLLAFLLSKQVQTILRWSQTGSNHPRFSSRTLLDLPIPDAVLGIQGEVGALVKAAVKLFEHAKVLYPEAEEELLERLGWDKLQEQKPELIFVGNIAELNRMGRVDAEHFHPKNRRLREQLIKAGTMRLADFCPLPNRGVQPSFVPDGDVFVLASKAIRPQGVAPVEDARTDIAFWSDAANEKARVRNGDVLLNSTGVGTLGRASFYMGDTPAIADNHVAIIRPDEVVCLPPYLSLFLNSPAGIAQSEMFQTGSSGQLEIYPQHIQEILIYLPRNRDGSIDLAWQKKLADKVVGASLAKQQAQEKLAQAKKMVEEAILKSLW